MAPSDPPHGASDAGEVRKLAAIVAVDAVGYSAAAEADERSALARLHALSARIAAVAAAHGGRVFSTAGDGFMLEFPTASGAFDAAAALAADSPTPVRIGAHLGEMAQTASGDLLGHGVNVTARIQARGEANTPLVSADLKRALRGARADRLTPRGRIALDKMSETIEIFALDGGRPSPARHGRLRLAAVALVGALIAALAGALIFLRPWAKEPPSPRLAILPFDTGGDGQLGRFAGALRDDLQSEIGQAGVDLLSPTAITAPNPAGQSAQAVAQGAGVMLTGTLSAMQADSFHLGLRLTLANPQVMVWSFDQDGALKDESALRQQISVQVADVLRCAIQRGAVRLGADALRTYLLACENRRHIERSDLERSRQLYRRLQSEAPRFSRGWSGLAFADTYYAERGLPPLELAAVRAEAREAARKALALNPQDGDAYAALARLSPPHAWAEREGWLRKGVAVEPDNTNLHASLAEFLNQVGRVQEAVVERERAHELDPLSPNMAAGLAYGWLNTGRETQADALMQQTMAKWPWYPGAWRYQVRTLVWRGRLGEARALTMRMSEATQNIALGELADWRTLIEAVPPLGRPLRAAQHETLVNLSQHGANDLAGDAILALAQHGDLDTAFASAHDRFVAHGDITLPLFNPPASALWRDARFMGLAADLGLLAYWRDAGQWPDFCRRSDLGYDCKAEARRRGF